MLPGFFDVARLTGRDVAVIVGMSGAIPFLLNLCMGATLAALRARLATPAGLRRMNLASGWLLIFVGLVLGAGQIWAGRA